MDFATDNLHALLDATSDAGLDALSFGVIGLDAVGLVCRYSAPEARMAGLQREHVLGQPFFPEIGRCMNNSLVAQRYANARAAGETLDEIIDYVMAFRSQLTPVKLRMLANPQSKVQYLLVQRQQPSGV